MYATYSAIDKMHTIQLGIVPDLELSLFEEILNGELQILLEAKKLIIYLESPCNK